MNPNWPGSVLCAVDFSRPSAAAIRFAADLASATHARLTLVHAQFWQAPPYFTESQVAELNRQFRSSLQEADRAVEEFAASACPGCAAERVTVNGAPVDAILKTAGETAAGLVVMGTHGRSGFNRFLLGSVAERVLRESAVPVATVRAVSDAGTEAQPIRKILCPVNDSAAASRSLKVAANLASSLGAELIALHIVEPHASGPRPAICDWVPESDRKACKLQEMVVSGDAAERILAAAAEMSAGLIVIGSQSRPFGDSAVIGATTVRVVRHSPVPVLTVGNPGQAGRPLP